MVTSPDQRPLILRNLVQLVDQGVDVRRHGHQDRGRPFIHRGERVHRAGTDDDELARGEPLGLVSDRHVQSTGQYGEGFITLIVDVQRRLRSQIPPAKHEVRHRSSVCTPATVVTCGSSEVRILSLGTFAPAVRGFALAVCSNGGTLAGGAGGGVPSRFSRIHLPRSTGEVRVA